MQSWAQTSGGFWSAWDDVVMHSKQLFPTCTVIVHNIRLLDVVQFAVQTHSHRCGATVHYCMVVMIKFCLPGWSVLKQMIYISSLPWGSSGRSCSSKRFYHVFNGWCVWAGSNWSLLFDAKVTLSMMDWLDRYWVRELRMYGSQLLFFLGYYWAFAVWHVDGHRYSNMLFYSSRQGYVRY